jgi:hypothetical protein
MVSDGSSELVSLQERPPVHIPRRSLSEITRQYCEGPLSFSFYITKPEALPLMKKTFRVLYTGRVQGEGIGWCGEGKGMIVVDAQVVMNFSPNYP